MSFAADFVTGCCVGGLLCFSLLFYFNAIPDELAHPRKQPLSVWQASAVIIALMLLSAFVYELLHVRVHRLVFICLVLLLLILVAARIGGAVASLISQAFAVALLCSILPPAYSLRIAS